MSEARTDLDVGNDWAAEMASGTLFARKLRLDPETHVEPHGVAFAHFARAPIRAELQERRALASSMTWDANIRRVVDGVEEMLAPRAASQPSGFAPSLEP